MEKIEIWKLRYLFALGIIFGAISIFINWQTTVPMFPPDMRLVGATMICIAEGLALVGVGALRNYFARRTLARRIDREKLIAP